jgi:circadian clock protein KaiC
MATTSTRKKKSTVTTLEKAPTGILGLDEITGGGLPRGRTTLVTGGPGCGKTLLATQFIVNGIIRYGEPGVYIAFEETAEELTTNMASLGVDLNKLVNSGKLIIDHIHVDPSEIEHAGAYDLEPLFLRIAAAAKEVRARRVALDTVEVLFAGLPDPLTIRAEVRRLFRFLKDRQLTAVATGERSDTALTRHNLEEFVSDCVIKLDHRTQGEISTRHLQVVKYRGSTHGTNSYPFLIDPAGITVTPITSLGLEHRAPTERVSSGIPRLDVMLGGQGFFRGSSTLISGAAGTGKTSVAVHFINAACRRGERALYFVFEESQNQIIRNMRSIGIDLEQWVNKGLLRFHAVRPTSLGLETHLSQMHKEIRDFNPQVVAVDPLSNLIAVGTVSEANSMVRRLIDFLKIQEITAVFTDLSSGTAQMTETEIGVSSLMDTWLQIRHIEHNGERNRGLVVLKSRGTAHSNQVREFVLTRDGADLADVYVGPGGVLTGSAKVAEQRRAQVEESHRRDEVERRRQAFKKRQAALESQIAAMRAEFDAELLEFDKSVARDQDVIDAAAADRVELAHIRSNSREGKETQARGGRRK